MSQPSHLRPTHATINLESVRKNFQWLKSLTWKQDFICPMVKANAYGHGDVKVAMALSQAGCENFGVVTIQEAVGLKESGLKGNIFLYGFDGVESAKEIIHQDFIPVVSDWHQLKTLSGLVKNPINIHLKFNTGMNRLGFLPDQSEKLFDFLKENKNLCLTGLATHLHSAEDLLKRTDESTAFVQLEEFKKVCEQFSGLPVVTHAYNSAAVAAVTQQNQSLEFGCRPGLLTYGIDPIIGESIKSFLSPVMEFKSKIVATQRVKLGEVVSYGGIWTADKDSLIGVIPAGYADGVCRSLSNRGEILIKGRKVRMCGHVCMDYVMVDLTSFKLQEAQLLGEEVVLFGQQGDQVISIEEVAHQAGRVSYEIVTGISNRVPRLYGDGKWNS